MPEIMVLAYQKESYSPSYFRNTNLMLVKFSLSVGKSSKNEPVHGNTVEFKIFGQKSMTSNLDNLNMRIAAIIPCIIAQLKITKNLGSNVFGRKCTFY